MSFFEVVVVALIAAFPPTIAAILSWLAARKSKALITQVHIQYNSRMDKLLEVIGASERAKGVLEGKAERDDT